MAVQNYKVEYSTLASGTVALTNVQSITVNVGRQRQLDQYNASTATVVLRYPTGYASPIAQLVPGTVIRIANNANDSASFKGKISNVQAQYGMPYSGGVGNADYLTISCEGSLAEFGRKSGVGYVMASAVVSAQLGNASTQSGYTAFLDSGVGDALMGSTTVSGTWADFLNYVALSNNFRMNDVYENLGSLDLQTVLISPFLQREALSVALSDTTNNATNQVYDQIEFASYADNFYTQVSVDPESFAPQTVTSGAAPYRTYTVNTINGSASQALDYANYLLNNYKTPKVAISSISCLANAQNSMQLDALGMVGLLRTGRQIGRILNVTFRGTTYPCVIEGYTFSASPGEARYTYYVSAADLNAYLILDNATFGRLDFNRLGY
jgi:hypothetical protein